MIHGEPKNEAPFTRTMPNRDTGNPQHHEPTTPRQLLHALMTETAGNRYAWKYEEVRPLKYPQYLARGVNADCSFACQILNRWANLPDPSGGNYDGYGNSTSMFHHLPHITLASARTGDFIVFGPEGSWHATIIYAPSATNPLLWSHGHQGAPNLYPLAADLRRPITVLRNEAP